MDREDERLETGGAMGDSGDHFEEELPRQRPIVLRLVALVTALAFLGLAVSAVFPLLELPPAEIIARSLQLEKDINVRQLQAAVVKVSVVTSRGQKAGTGFNVDPRGIIVTNHHVIEGARTISIKFPGGRIYKVTSRASKPDFDLAVLRVSGEGLPAVPLAKGEMPSPGEKVCVVGNPLGLNNIVVEGRLKDYVTLKDRSERVFVIDAPVYPGNSGSPVFNRRGEVVGVVFGRLHREANGKSEIAGVAISVRELLSLRGDS